MTIAGALAVPTTAAAAPQASDHAAVLPPHIEGTIEPYWKQELAAGLGEGLSRGRFALVPEDDVALALKDHDGPCRDDACYRWLAERTGSAYVVSGRVARSEVGDYELSVALHDASGATIAEAASTCDLCGAKDAVDKFSDLATSLRAQLDARIDSAPILHLTTRPDGADVAVDGTPAGTAPIELTLTPGPHELEVSAPGHAVLRLRVTGVAGVEERRDLALEPLETPTNPRNRAMRITGWALVGSGLAVLPAGATLVAIDSRQYRRNCRPDVNGTCAQSYDTLAGGVGVLVGGAVGVVVGSVLVAVAKRRARKAASR